MNIKYIFIVLFTLMCVSNASALSWSYDPSITNGIIDGMRGAPDVFTYGGNWYAITSEYEWTGAEYDTFWYGYVWNGSGWNSNSTIINGIGADSTQQYHTITTFVYGGNLIAIVGKKGDYDAYKWNGGGWSTYPTFLNGLPINEIWDANTETYFPEIFYIGNNLYMLVGLYNNGAIGYDWNGTGWSSNSTISNGVPSGCCGYGGYERRPEIFTLNSDIKLITGSSAGLVGYEWNGTGWTTDPELITGVELYGDSPAPTVFNINTLNIIYGTELNGYYGFIPAIPTYIINNTDNRVFSSTSTAKPIATDNGFTLTAIAESFNITQYNYAVYPKSGSTAQVIPNVVTNNTIASITITNNTVDRLMLWGLYEDIEYYLVKDNTLIETQVGDADGNVNFTTDLLEGSTYIVTAKPFIVVYAFDAETLGSIATFNTTFNDTAKNTSIGYILYSNITFGSYTLITSSDGYITDTRTVEVTEPTAVIVMLEREGSIYTAKHFVKFIVSTIFGTKIPETTIQISGNVSAPNANITATIVNGTTRLVSANGFTTSYTSSSLIGTTLFGGNIGLMNGVTGVDGSATFKMYEDVQYNLVFTTPTGAVKTMNIYPKDDEYTVLFGSTAVIPDDRPDDKITYAVYKNSINLTTGYVNATFNDTSNTTTLAEYWVNYTNGTNAYYTNTTATAGTFSALVPGGNASYVTKFKITNTELTAPVTVQRIVTFTDTVRYSLGFDSGWKYRFVAIVLIGLIGLLGSALNADKIAVLVVLTGWFMVFLGWLQAGMTTGQEITMGLMLMLATLIAFGTVVRKGDPS